MLASRSASWFRDQTLIIDFILLYVRCDASSTRTPGCYFAQKLGKKVEIHNECAAGCTSRNVGLVTVFSEGQKNWRVLWKIFYCILGYFHTFASLVQFLKEVTSVHQGCIYLNRNTVKTAKLWNNITISSNSFQCEYICKYNLLLWSKVQASVSHDLQK